MAEYASFPTTSTRTPRQCTAGPRRIQVQRGAGIVQRAENVDNAARPRERAQVVHLERPAQVNDAAALRDAAVVVPGATQGQAAAGHAHRLVERVVAAGGDWCPVVSH